VFHVLNRGNERRTIFESEGDYLAFLRVMCETVEAVPMRILAWCLMPNHWHLLLWPKEDGELGRFMQRLTTTHVRRWRLHRHSVGYGHLYQGTYKSFPVESDEHFYTVCRYVERNALRAKLVKRAEQWPWSSLGHSSHPAAAGESPPPAAWPVPRSRLWT
jgi:putative transposase